jgi:hypothetical protein
MFFVQEDVVPAIGEIGGEIVEEIFEEIESVIGCGQGGSLDGIKGPDPGVFVVVDFVAEFVEGEEVVEIIPGDAA